MRKQADITPPIGNQDPSISKSLGEAYFEKLENMGLERVEKELASSQVKKNGFTSIEFFEHEDGHIAPTEKISVSGDGRLLDKRGAEVSGYTRKVPPLLFVEGWCQKEKQRQLRNSRVRLWLPIISSFFTALIVAVLF